MKKMKFIWVNEKMGRKIGRDRFNGKTVIFMRVSENTVEEMAMVE